MHASSISIALYVFIKALAIWCFKVINTFNDLNNSFERFFSFDFMQITGNFKN